jgi:hypothetical protein
LPHTWTILLQKARCSCYRTLFLRCRHPDNRIRNVKAPRKQAETQGRPKAMMLCISNQEYTIARDLAIRGYAMKCRNRGRHRLTLGWARNRAGLYQVALPTASPHYGLREALPSLQAPHCLLHATAQPAGLQTKLRAISARHDLPTYAL